MKAVVQARYGSPEALDVRDVEVPRIGNRDVLVRVRAASLHPDVWHVVAGRPFALRMMGAGIFWPLNPIPGTDMSGIVERVGAHVTQFQAGDAVFGETVPREAFRHLMRDQLLGKVILAPEVAGLTAAESANAVR